MSFVDLKKVFDRVKLSDVINNVKEKEVRKRLLTVIKDIYTNREKNKTMVISRELLRRNLKIEAKIIIKYVINKSWNFNIWELT